MRTLQNDSIHVLVGEIQRIFQQVTNHRWEVTSVDRSDLTSHADGRAVDLAIRDHPLHQKLLDGGCPYYYNDREFLRLLSPCWEKLASIPNVHLILIERDHVHVEVSRHPRRRRCEVAIYRKASSGYCPEPSSQLVSIWRSDKHMFGSEEEGGLLLPDEGGGLDEYSEEGGILLEEEGGPEDDPNWLAEEGGINGEMYEEGGKKKRRFRLVRRKGKGQRRCPPPGSNVGGNMVVPSLIEQRSMSLRNGVPFISVERGIKVNVSPIPLEYRVPRQLALFGMMSNAGRTGQPPIITSIAPAAGPYALNLLPPVGSYIEAPIVILDVGPQALTTQAGATLTTRITGRYVDGSLADLGEFSLQLPNVIKVMRIIYIPYSVYNGVPVFKLLYAANQYTTPLVPALLGPLTQDPDSAGDIEAPISGPIGTVTQAITISGVVPAGLQLTGTIVTPTHPLWSSIAGSLACGCK